MKKFILIGLLFIIPALAFCQGGSDSLAYQLQRKKINGMLAARSKKFDQYSESLAKHSGIFGLQTKNDIRRSNDILMDIVKTDDDVYKQLKILLDFRAYQQTQAQNHSKETDDNTLGYMNTINKLRRQNDQLKADSEKAQQDEANTRRIYVGALVFLVLIIVYLASRKRKARAL